MILGVVINMRGYYLWMSLLTLIVSGCVTSVPPLSNESRFSFSSFSECTADIESSGTVSVVDSIVLDLSKEFRLWSVDRVIEKNGVIYALDWSRKKLVSYSLLTKSPYHVIGRMGRSNKEYLQITGFDVDVNNHIWILDSQSDRVLEYSETGEYLSQRHLKFDAIDIKCLDNGDFMFVLLPFNSHQYKNSRVIRCDSKCNLIRNVLLYDMPFDKNALLSTYAVNSVTDSSFYICNNYIDDSVTLFGSSGEITLTCTVSFGKYDVPMNARQDLSSHHSDFGMYRCCCPPFYMDDRYVVGNFFNRGEYDFFIADMVDHLLYIDGERCSRKTLVGICDGKLICYSGEANSILFYELAFPS